MELLWWQKMITESVIKDLEEIVNRGLEDAAIPYAKGKSIRIKQFVIRESSKGFLIYNSTENKQVARTQFKSTAVAIAKNLALNNDVTSKVLSIDNTLSKHYNDAVFYKNMIKKSLDNNIKDIRQTRLDISIAKSAELRKDLDRFIYC